MSIEKRRYNEQELREVLRRVQRGSDASGAAADSEGLTRREIVETAQELGYSEKETTTALVQFEEEQRLVHAEAELRQLSYRRVSGNFIAWTVANSVLWLTGLWASHPPWLIVIMGMWTLWLLLQLRGALFPHPDTLRQAAKKRLVDQAFTKSRREFTASVKAGTAKLLSMSAKHIDEKVEKLSDKS